MEKNFFTIAEVQKEVFSNTITRPTILKLVKNGEIPSVQLGKKTLIPGSWARKILRQAAEG